VHVPDALRKALDDGDVVAVAVRDVPGVEATVIARIMASAARSLLIRPFTGGR
jgi:hypothetical protein